jgi:DNA-damage-inducible protein J
MATETVVRARIDAATKEEATEALAAMGLSVSDAIRLLLTRIAAEKAFPFEVKVPNAKTRKAMAELEAGKGKGKGKRFATAEALFKDLGI